MIFYQLLPTPSVENEQGQQMRIQILILGLKGLNDILSDIDLCGSGAGKSLVCFSSYPNAIIMYFFAKEVEGRFILVGQ